MESIPKPLGYLVALIAASTVGWDVLLNKAGDLPFQHSQAEVLPEPELTMKLMASASHNHSVQLAACRHFKALIGQGSGIRIASVDFQSEFVRQGAHKRVYEALRTHVENEDVQLECASLLANAVQWNQENSKALGPEAVHLLGDALRRFQGNPRMHSLIGSLGSFCDFHYPNRAAALESGALDLGAKLADDFAYIEDTVLMWHCLVSTQDAPEANWRRIADLGYIEKSIEHMRRYRWKFGIRGEIVWDLRLHYAQVPEYHSRIVEAGYIPEILEVMEDEPTMFAKGESQDPIGAPGVKTGMARCLNSCLIVLEALARKYQERLIAAGALDRVVDVFNRIGDVQETAPWGAQFDVTDGMCRLLHVLVQGREEQMAALKASGFLSKIATTRSGLGTSCGLLRRLTGS